MKLLPLASSCLLLLAVAPVQAQVSVQQMLSTAQTAYIRGDTDTAKKQFEEVLRADPKNQLAINYLRMIRVHDDQKPKGNSQEKALAAVILPKIEFREATIGSAFDFIKTAVGKASGGAQSVNFVLKIPPEQANTQTVTLSLTNIPATEAIKYMADLANLEVAYDKYAVSISPKGGAAVAVGTVPAPAPATTTPGIPGLPQ
jgi:hypothetical protein